MVKKAGFTLVELMIVIAIIAIIAAIACMLMFLYEIILKSILKFFLRN